MYRRSILLLQISDFSWDESLSADGVVVARYIRRATAILERACI